MAAQQPALEDVFSSRPAEHVREKARIIGTRGEPPLTEWEAGFVQGLPERLWQEHFTKPQVAKLDEIDFLTQVVTQWRGQPTLAMLKTCYAERYELDEDDDAWVLSLWQRPNQVIYGRDVRHLARLTDRLNGDFDLD